jgi:hypothetical protein
MKAAFNAWIKTDPFNKPSSPFDTPEYKMLSDSDKVSSFLALADEKSENANRMSSIASNYVFFTSMYAGVSFLEGIGRVFPLKKMQMIFLVMGAVLFSGTSVVLFSTIPIF